MISATLGILIATVLSNLRTVYGVTLGSSGLHSMNSSGESKTDRLLRSVEAGDEVALEQLLESQRAYLRRLLEARMEAVLRQRVDPSDVIQETMLVASRRIDDFLARRPTTFRLWLRRKALERLVDARREHLALKRSVRREEALTDASSLALVDSIRCDGISALARNERIAQVRQALNELPAADREVLVLRHVEQLSNAEAAEVLKIDPKTASKRYGRAVLRLSQALDVNESSQS